MSELFEFTRPITAPTAQIANITIETQPLVIVSDTNDSEMLPIPIILAADSRKYYGAHPESNWAILGSLMAGAYPAYGDRDKETDHSLIGILNTGITVFICLQAEYIARVPESVWRKAAGIRPYMLDIERLLACKDLYPDLTVATTFADMEFHHLPIVDCKTGADDTVWEFAKQIAQMIRDGKKIYLHCWGGHGRTGTLVCLIYHILYGITATEAIVYCNRVHRFRTFQIEVGSPQTAEQEAQVRRLINASILRRRQMELAAKIEAAAEMVVETEPEKNTDV